MMMPHKTESFLSSIGTAVLWKGLDRVSGLLKHIVIAGAIGLSAQLDVFYMVTALLGVFVFSWASLIDVIAVPRMVEVHQSGHYDVFKKVSGGLFTLTLVGSLFLAVAFYVFRNNLADIALGFESERSHLLMDSIPWLLPVILLYIPLRLLGAVLRALRLFSLFYQAEFITALTVLVCVYFFREDPLVLLWSFSLGITCAFVFLFFKASKLILPLSSPFSTELRASLQMAPGLLILQASQYVYVLSDRIFVSYLPEGSVSALSYAMTLIAFLPSLIAISGSLITVIAEQGSRQERSARTNDLLSMVIYIGLGATCFMLLAGQAMVQVLLERGVFTREDTASVGTAITAFAWMILPLFLIGPLDQIFQVEKKIGFMVRRTLFGMVVNIVLNAWFLFGLEWGLFGVALSTSISYWIMLLSGLEGVAKLGYQIDWGRHLKWMLWVMGFLSIIYLTLSHLLPSDTSGFVRLVACATGIGAVMLTGGIFYSGHERRLIRQTLQRIIPRVNLK